MGEENTAINLLEHPELYAEYLKHERRVTFILTLFCMVFVMCVTFVIYKSENTKLIWLYLLPTLCYLFS